jgi:hypothetical protein
MRLVQGSVAVLETGAGVAGVTVVVYARGDANTEVRVGSVATDARGEFRLEADSAKFVWDLRLEVQAAAPKPTVIYADSDARVGAGDVETWTIRIPTATLTSAGRGDDRARAARARERARAVAGEPGLRQGDP